MTISVQQFTKDIIQTSEKIIRSTDSVPCLLEPIHRTAGPSQISESMFQNDGNYKVADLIDTVKEMDVDELQVERGAESPNTWARKCAEWILLDTPQFTIPDRVAPSIQGGVAMFFYAADKYADIECFNSGEILGTTATGNGEPEIWTIRPNEIK